MLPPNLRTATAGLAVALLAILLAACSLLQAERVVVRSLTYWLVIECRGDIVPSANGCREWAERLIAASPYPAPESTNRLILTNQGGRCEAMFVDRDGNPLQALGVDCP